MKTTVKSTLRTFPISIVTKANRWDKVGENTYKNRVTRETVLAYKG